MDADLPLGVAKIEFRSAVFSGNRICRLDIEHFDGTRRSAMGHSEAQRDVIRKVCANYRKGACDQNPFYNWPEPFHY